MICRDETMNIITLCLDWQSLSTRIGLQFKIEGTPTTERLIVYNEIFAAEIQRKAALPNEISLVWYPSGEPDNHRKEWIFYDLDIEGSDWRVRGRVAYNPYTCSLALCKVK